MFRRFGSFLLPSSAMVQESTQTVKVHVELVKGDDVTIDEVRHEYCHIYSLWVERECEWKNFADRVSSW